MTPKTPVILEDFRPDLAELVAREAEQRWSVVASAASLNHGGWKSDDLRVWGAQGSGALLDALRDEIATWGDWPYPRPPQIDAWVMVNLRVLPPQPHPPHRDVVRRVLPAHRGPRLTAHDLRAEWTWPKDHQDYQARDPRRSGGGPTRGVPGRPAPPRPATPERRPTRHRRLRREVSPDDEEAEMARPTQSQIERDVERALDAGDAPSLLPAVQSAARAVTTRPERIGDKVFLAAVWDRLGPVDRSGRRRGISLDEFKRWAIEQHRAQHLTLARADFVQGMPPKLVARSEARYGNATFHFLIDEPTNDRDGRGGQTDDDRLAVVRDAVRRAPSRARYRDSDNVFISEVWRIVGGRLGMTLPEFKQWLIDANRRRDLRLTRADLIDDMDSTQVEESEIQYLNTTNHFIADDDPLPRHARGREMMPSVATVTDAQFAQAVRAALPKIDARGRFGPEKVFISAVVDQLSKSRPFNAWTQTDFKEAFLRASRKLLSLARADLVGAMDRTLVQRSEIQDPRGPVFHFVLDYQTDEPETPTRLDVVSPRARMEQEIREVVPSLAAKRTGVASKARSRAPSPPTTIRTTARDLYFPGGDGGGGDKTRRAGSAVVLPHVRTSRGCVKCGQYHTLAEHDRHASKLTEPPKLKTAKRTKAKTATKPRH
jgi:hypothetical protein